MARGRRTQSGAKSALSSVLSLIVIAIVILGVWKANDGSIKNIWNLAKEKSNIVQEHVNNGTLPGAPAKPNTQGGSSPSESNGSAQPDTPADNGDTSAPNGDVINSIPTAEKDNSPYDRKNYKHWSLVGNSKCWDTRDEILARDADTATYYDKDGNETTDKNKACSVEGTWTDKYSGRPVNRARSIDIDHIIPLGYANGHGAASWDANKKEQFANDPENLIAVSARENRSKSDKGPADYLPSDSSYACEYANKFVHIAHKYGLSMSQADKDAAVSACQ